MILASQSPRRLEILQELGFAPKIVPAGIDEEVFPNEDPVELVERLARQKARAVWQASSPDDEDELIVAADTVVWLGNDCLGKPHDAEDARAMLHELSGVTHHVSTGVCIIKNSFPAVSGQHEQLLEITSFVETSDVEFYELTDDQIDAYVASGEPLDKAGAYGIQAHGRLLVKSITGDYYNVVGLPVARLIREMDALIGDSNPREKLVIQALLGNAEMR